MRLQGCNAARNSQDSIFHNKRDTQKNHLLERSIKSLECLNTFNGTNLTLNDDVFQVTQMFGSHERSLSLSMHHLLVHTNQDIKRR